MTTWQGKLNVPTAIEQLQEEVLSQTRLGKIWKISCKMFFAPSDIALSYTFTRRCKSLRRIDKELVSQVYQYTNHNGIRFCLQSLISALIFMCGRVLACGEMMRTLNSQERFHENFHKNKMRCFCLPVLQRFHISLFIVKNHDPSECFSPVQLSKHVWRQMIT